MADVNLSLVLLASFVASSSPGPATLAIAGTSMSSGRKAGMALASGITVGSLTWSAAAACGLGAFMLANTWIFEFVRYFGAAYLMYLAFNAARSALSGKALTTKTFNGRRRDLFVKGLGLHLTNPKAILFFGSLYSLGVPANATPQDLGLVFISVGVQACLIFHGYALLFSSERMTRIYLRLQRWFEAIFAVGFGAAGFKILTSRLQDT